MPKKYWVGTQQPGGDGGRRTSIAKRDFIVIMAGKPSLIRAGDTFWQNRETKQCVFQRSPYPLSGTSDVSHCSICGAVQHAQNAPCPNSNEFWVSTQCARNAVPKRAKRDFIVMYCGQPCEIKQGQRFWQNVNTKQVVVGWHGSVSPPVDMHGENIVRK